MRGDRRHEGFGNGEGAGVDVSNIRLLQWDVTASGEGGRRDPARKDTNAAGSAFNLTLLGYTEAPPIVSLHGKLAGSRSSGQ